MSKNIRKRKTKLWHEKNGMCYWCGTKTVLPKRQRQSQPALDNLATLDHLKTRFDKDRTKPNTNNEERTVLSCLKCNGIRGALIEKIHKDLTIKVKSNNFNIKPI